MKKDYNTRAFALGYVLLGGYYLWDKAILSNQTIASLSVTALCFVLSDAAKAYSNKFPKCHVLVKSLKKLSIFLNALGFILAIIGPFLILKKLGFSDDTYGVIGNGVSLIGLGLTIYLMAKRNEKQEE